MPPHENLKAGCRHPGSRSDSIDQDKSESWARGLQPRPSSTVTHNHAEPSALRPGDAGRARTRAAAGESPASADHHPGRHATGADPSRQPSRQSPEVPARVTVPEQPVRPVTGTSQRGPSRDRGRSESPIQQAVVRVLCQSLNPAATRKVGHRNEPPGAIRPGRRGTGCHNTRRKGPEKGSDLPLKPTALGPGRGRSVAGRGNGQRRSDQGGPGPAASERDRIRPGTGRRRHDNLKESRRRSRARTAPEPNRTTSSRAGPEQRGDRVKEAVRIQSRATTRSRQRN